MSNPVSCLLFSLTSNIKDSVQLRRCLNVLGKEKVLVEFSGQVAYRKFTTDCFSAGCDRILSRSTLPSPGLMNAPKKERTGQRLVEESAHCAPGLPQAVTACLPACQHSLISSAALPKTKGVNAILNTHRRDKHLSSYLVQFR